MPPIRTVIAGVGLRGLYLTPTLLENDSFRIVGVIDVMPERMTLLCDEFRLGDIGRYTSVEQCISGCDFDAMIVLTPDCTHADVVVPALRAGKYVYVEKPLDTTAERMAAIIAADAAAGGRVFVGFNVRFAPIFAAMRNLIEQGVAGRLLTVHGDEFYDGGRTYFRRWNRLNRFGGLWLNKASHDFDLMQWFAGGKPVRLFARAAVTHYRPRPDAAMYCRDCDLAPTCPDHFNRCGDPSPALARLHAVTEKVTGQKADLCLFNSDKDTFDHAAALVEFDNDVIATYSCNLVAGFTNRTVRITGVKAMIEGDMAANRIIIRRRDPSGEEVITPDRVVGGHGGGDVVIMQCFADFVRGKPTRQVPVAEAAIAVHMGLAAARSCATGEVVAL